MTGTGTEEKQQGFKIFLNIFFWGIKLLRVILLYETKIYLFSAIFNEP